MCLRSGMINDLGIEATTARPSLLYIHHLRSRRKDMACKGLCVLCYHIPQGLEDLVTWEMCLVLLTLQAFDAFKKECNCLIDWGRQRHLVTLCQLCLLQLAVETNCKDMHEM